MFLTPQQSALMSLGGLLGWIAGHQASHAVAVKSGKANLSYPLAVVIEIESGAGILFLLWYIYKSGIKSAVILFIGSFIIRLCLIQISKMLGLLKRAWIISLAGIPIIPIIIAALVWLVFSPIETNPAPTDAADTTDNVDAMTQSQFENYKQAIVDPVFKAKCIADVVKSKKPLNGQEIDKYCDCYIHKLTDGVTVAEMKLASSNQEGRTAKERKAFEVALSCSGNEGAGN